MGDFILFLLVGFFAQMVDGALGMAYGVISSTTLLAFGVSPAHASAAVHTAEVFTTAASGSSHLYHRNIDWKLFWRLAPFGILGGCAGAYVLTGLAADVMKPIVTAYLALVGAWLILRSFRKIPSKPVAPPNPSKPVVTIGPHPPPPAASKKPPIAPSGATIVERHGKPRTVDNMVAYFGYWGDAEIALNAGDSSAGNTSGGVAQDDCGAFNAFVALSRHYTYTPTEMVALQRRHALLLSKDPLGITFEVALSKYLKGKQSHFSRLERALLMARLLCK